MLGAGVHVVLGAPEDGTIALYEVAAGVRAPLSGRVVVHGRDPAKSPALRRRIAALGPGPDLPPAGSVGELLQTAMRARGESGVHYDAVLDPLGLSPLHRRHPRTLSLAELRGVELGLALTTPAPLACVLYEPLAEVAIAQLGLVRERIAEMARAGACVLVLTSSPADARALADDILVLHHGALVRGAAGDGSGLAPWGGGELTAWIAAPAAGAPNGGVRALAAALAARREVRAVAWEEPADGSGAWLRVRGDDLDACACALAESALATEAAVDSIACSAPGLTQVRVASDLALRALRPSAPWRAGGAP